MRIPKALRTDRIDFQDVRKSLYCSIADHSVVPIRDQEKWERVWADFLGGQPAQAIPEVDFDKDMLIGVFRGAFPHCGFSTTVKRVVDAKFRGGRFRWVVIAEHDPRGLVRMDLTNPHHIIRLPKSRLFVRPFFYRSWV